MEFLKKCQEWMSVNVNKVTQTNNDKETEVTDGDSAKRLLRGGSRDTLLSSENTDEDSLSRTLLLRSRESLQIEDDINEHTLNSYIMDEIISDALQDPDGILWHPPSADFKVTIPIKNKKLPLEYIVKKSTESQECYFLVSNVDSKSSCCSKLQPGDWLQSVKADDSQMIALTNESSKRKFESLMMTSKCVTIIFQRPKSLRRAIPTSTSSKYEVPGRNRLSECSDTDHSLMQDDKMLDSNDSVNHLDINLSLCNRLDKSSVSNLFQDGLSQSEESNYSAQSFGQTKGGKGRRTSKVHPSSVGNTHRQNVDFPIHSSALGVVRQNLGLSSVMAANSSGLKFHLTHRRSLSESATCYFKDSANKNLIQRSASLGDLHWSPSIDSVDEHQNESLSTHVSRMLEFSLSTLDMFSLKKVPQISLVVVCPMGSDKDHVKRYFCDLINLPYIKDQHCSRAIFLLEEGEPMTPFSKTLVKKSLADEVVKKLKNTDNVNQLILAGHCASELRRSIPTSDKLSAVTRSLLTSQKYYKNIPEFIIGYFLINPPKSNANFVLIQCKIVLENELAYKRHLLTRHSIACVLLDVKKISADPGNELVSFCNNMNIINSYTGLKIPTLLAGFCGSKNTKNFTRVATYFKENLSEDKTIASHSNHRGDNVIYMLDSSSTKSSSDDRMCIQKQICDLVTEQSFLKNTNFPLAAALLGLTLAKNMDANIGNVVTASRTQLMRLTGRRHDDPMLASMLTVLHHSGFIIYSDEIRPKRTRTTMADMFILLKPDNLAQSLYTMAQKTTSAMDHPLRFTSAENLCKMFPAHCSDLSERVAFLEVLHMIYPIKLGDIPSFAFVSPHDLQSSRNGSRKFKGDYSLMIDFHSRLPYSNCTQILCSMCSIFRGQCELCSPLIATFTGTFDFKIEFSPWNAVGVVHIRLKKKKPWQFMEYLLSFLDSSIDERTENLEFHVGPMCPLMSSGKCSQVREGSDQLHVISFQEESFLCGKTDLRNHQLIKEWLREIVYVHPYKPVEHDLPQGNGLQTIDLGMCLTELPDPLYSILCRELLIRDRWKALAGSMTKNQKDIAHIKTYDDPVNALFKQWASSEEHKYGPCSLGRLFHYFASCRGEQFFDIKTKVKDWIEENGYILTSSALCDTSDSQVLPNVI